MYEQIGDVRSFLDAGQLRPILMFSAASPAAGSAVPTSGQLGLGNGVPQFRAFVVKAGTPAAVVSGLAAAIERIATSADYKTFLETQTAAGDSFIAAGGARSFMDRELAQMQQVVQGLPMHAQYLFSDKEPGELPDQY